MVGRVFSPVKAGQNCGGALATEVTIMSKTRVSGRNIALALLGNAMFVVGLFYAAHWSWRGFADWRPILAYVGFGFVVWMVNSSIESAQMKARADSEQMIAEHQRKSKAIRSEVQVL
jgi:hypothetical protein